VSGEADAWDQGFGALRVRRQHAIVAVQRIVGTARLQAAMQRALAPYATVVGSVRLVNHFRYIAAVPDGDGAVQAIDGRSFHVILLAVDVTKRRGMVALEHLRANRQRIQSRVILIGEPNPELRNYAKVADETLLKPVDPQYVAERARAYCKH